MNLQEILYIARSRLRDLSMKQFSEAELIAACNDGISAIAAIIRQAREDYFLTSTTSTVATAVAPNPSTVTLPTDFLELKDMMIVTSGYEDIVFLAHDRTSSQFRTALLDGGSLSNGTGLIFYDIYGNSTLMLAPGFDLSLDLKIDYIQSIPNLSLPADIPSLIPTEFHANIPNYIVCEAMRSTGDPRLVAYLSAVESAEKSMGVAIQPRQIQMSKYVTGFMESDDW